MKFVNITVTLTYKRLLKLAVEDISNEDYAEDSMNGLSERLGFDDMVAEISITKEDIK